MDRFYDYRHPVYNSFDIKTFKSHNQREIKALLSVQRDIMDDVLSEEQQEIIEYVIIYNIPQKEVAEMLGIAPSSVSRRLNSALAKVRQYMEYCHDAIKYYEREGD